MTGDHDSWPLVSAALLSRMTTTMRSTMALQRRGQAVDAGTLVRSLYEHAVHFAWLAADPSPARIEAWRKHDLKRRLVGDDDAGKLGVEILDDQARAAMQAQVEGMQGGKLVLEHLAKEADTYWATRLPGMGDSTAPNSLRGLYALAYRYYSGTAHPSYRGINPVVEDVTSVGRRAVIERAHVHRGPYGMSTVLYGLALFIAAEAIGWPNHNEVVGVFDRFPGLTERTGC